MSLLVSRTLCAAPFFGPFCVQCIDGNSYLDVSLVSCRPCANAFAFFGPVLCAAAVCWLAYRFGPAVCVPVARNLPSRVDGLIRIYSRARRAVTANVQRLSDASTRVDLPVKAKLLLSFALIVAQLGDGTLFALNESFA